jgi:carbon monoxide dehydrogenase subunit G
MQLAGQSEIVAGRARVWETISNPNRVAGSSKQGSAQVEKIDDRHFRVTLAAPGMPVEVVLGVALTDVTEPSRIAAVVTGNFMGGPINGTGEIALAELAPKLTRLTWSADAMLGGMLGALEGMLVGLLQQAADQSVAALKERLEAEEAAGAAG